jgi:putative ABC transport system substrate-binding protein
MKKIVIVLALGIIGALGIYRWYLAPAASQQIAVVMTMNHPALDSVREAFISRIKADLPDIEVVDFNAQGNMQQANLIAAEIANSKRVMGVLAIGTLAAQTLAKAELNKPIVIAAVSDASVITSKNQAANVCGMTDSIDAQYQIKAILELLPELKSISLLYSPHEANSAAMVKKLAPQAEAKGIKVMLVGVQEAQQIMSSSMLACQKSDAVLIPLDNQLVAAMPAVIKATKNSPCPIITSNESPLHQGATIAFGVNYRQSGEEAGTIMIKILVEKRAPREIGFINPAQVELYLNQAVIKEKGIKLTIQGEV